MATRCCWPPDKVSGLALYSLQPTASGGAPARSPPRESARASSAQVHAPEGSDDDVVKDAQPL